MGLKLQQRKSIIRIKYLLLKFEVLHQTERFNSSSIPVLCHVFTCIMSQCQSVYRIHPFKKVKSSIENSRKKKKRKEEAAAQIHQTSQVHSGFRDAIHWDKPAASSENKCMLIMMNNRFKVSLDGTHRARPKLAQLPHSRLNKQPGHCQKNKENSGDN